LELERYREDVPLSPKRQNGNGPLPQDNSLFCRSFLPNGRGEAAKSDISAASTTAFTGKLERDIAASQSMPLILMFGRKIAVAVTTRSWFPISGNLFSFNPKQILQVSFGQ
jgi:hypothetical protein